jgi:hypothetical protein
MRIIVDEMPKTPFDCFYSASVQAGIGFNRTTCRCKINGTSCENTNDCTYLKEEGEENE